MRHQVHLHEEGREDERTLAEYGQAYPLLMCCHHVEREERWAHACGVRSGVPAAHVLPPCSKRREMGAHLRSAVRRARCSRAATMSLHADIMHIPISTAAQRLGYFPTAESLARPFLSFAVITDSMKKATRPATKSDQALRPPPCTSNQQCLRDGWQSTRPNGCSSRMLRRRPVSSSWQQIMSQSPVIYLYC